MFLLINMSLALFKFKILLKIQKTRKDIEIILFIVKNLVVMFFSDIVNLKGLLLFLHPEKQHNINVLTRLLFFFMP